jgi:dUTP pyrophosphatase
MPSLGPIVRVRRTSSRQPELPLPAYQTPGSAGADLRADLETPLTLEPGQRALVPTGFAVEIPDGFEGQVRPRSGLAVKHGVAIPNAPGTIDSDYRGELQVLLVNLGQAALTLQRGDRIAQLIIAPVVRADFVLASELGETARGAGGFGSTGR